MNKSALAIYSVAFLADLAGLCVGWLDLRQRLGLLTTFSQETPSDLPLTYNVDPGVLERLADSEPTMIAARLRNGLNEMIRALAEERGAREATEERLARLSGVGDNPRRLRFAAVLLAVGVVLGGLGNLVSSLG